MEYNITFRKATEPKKKTWTTPTGTIYDLFQDALSQSHLLIAGSTGSGKSVLINGLLSNVLLRLPGNGPGRARLILVDPKRIELAAYKSLPHTIAHAGGRDPQAWLSALTIAVQIMDDRYNEMERNPQQHPGKLFNGGDVYVVIDEWATVLKGDLRGNPCKNAVLRLTSEGRAARVHVILATQVPKANIIPTEIRDNFTAKFALMCQTAQESRVIMNMNGCETLPDPKHCGRAYGYYCLPGKSEEDPTMPNNILKCIPFVPEEETNRMIDFWMVQSKPKRRGFFSSLFATA